MGKSLITKSNADVHSNNIYLFSFMLYLFIHISIIQLDTVLKSKY